MSNAKTKKCLKCPRRVRVTTKDGLCYSCMMEVHKEPVDVFSGGTKK